MDYRTLLIGALIAATVPIAQALTTFNPEAITDWRAWAVGIAAGAVRQVAVYIVARISERAS
jgi:hypothetical protein